MNYYNYNLPLQQARLFSAGYFSVSTKISAAKSLNSQICVLSNVSFIVIVVFLRRKGGV